MNTTRTNNYFKVSIRTYSRVLTFGPDYLYGPHAPRRAFERVHTWVFPFCSKNDESVKAAHEKAGEKLSEIKALGLDDAPQLSVFRRFDGPTWSHRISLIGKLRNLDLN